MLSKNKIKLIQGLKLKKNRISSGLFVVEGIKSVECFLASHFELESLYCTDLESSFTKNSSTVLISEKELQKISFLKTPNKVLAVFKIYKKKFIEKNNLLVALDGIQDPGNLGTIIRLCDWFGVSQIVCSNNTVDCYNPKVIQASMGSMSRIEIHYTHLKKFLQNAEKEVYLSVLGGSSIYSTPLNSSGIVVMGCESKGISKEIQELNATKLTIPSFDKKAEVESLNVATATAIFLNEFRRGI